MCSSLIVPIVATGIEWMSNIVFSFALLCLMYNDVKENTIWYMIDVLLKLPAHLSRWEEFLCFMQSAQK